MFKKGMIRFRRKMAAVLAAAMLFSSYPLPAYAAGDPEGDSEYTVVEEGQDDGLVSGDEADAVSEDEAVSVSGGDADAASENETEAAEEDVASENETASGSKKDDTFVESEIPAVVTDNFELVGNAQGGSGLEATELYFSDFSSTTQDQWVDKEYVLFQPGGDFEGEDTYFFNGVWDNYYLDCSSEVVFNGFTIYDNYPVYGDRRADSANKIIVKKNISETINIPSASKNEVTAYAQFRDEGKLFEHTGIKFETAEDSEVAVVAKGGSGSKVYMKVEDKYTHEEILLNEPIPTAGTDKSAVVLFKAGADKTCYISADPGVCLYYLKVMPKSTNKTWDFGSDGCTIEGTTGYIDGIILDATKGYIDGHMFKPGAKLHVPVYDNSVMHITTSDYADYSTCIKVNGEDIIFTGELTFKCVEGNEKAGYITIEVRDNGHKRNYIDKIEIRDPHTVSFNALDKNVGSTVFGDSLWLDDRAVALAVESAVEAAPVGKVFAGWSETKNGEVFDFNTTISENKTFYAIYEDASNGELYFSEIPDVTDEGKLKYRFATVNGFTIYDKSDSQNCIRIWKQVSPESIPVSSASKANADTVFGFSKDQVYKSEDAYITFKNTVDSDIVIVAKSNLEDSSLYMETDEYVPSTDEHVFSTQTASLTDNKTSVVVFEAKANSLCKIHFDHLVDVYYIKAMPKSQKTSWDFRTENPFGALGTEISGTTAYVDGLYIDTTDDNAQIYQNDNRIVGICLKSNAAIYVPVREKSMVVIDKDDGSSDVSVNDKKDNNYNTYYSTDEGSGRKGYTKISGSYSSTVKTIDLVDACSVSLNVAGETIKEVFAAKDHTISMGRLLNAKSQVEDQKNAELVDKYIAGWYIIENGEKTNLDNNFGYFEYKDITEDMTVYASIKKLISAEVTFKVVNGSWDDGTDVAATADKNVTLTGIEGDTLSLSADQIPAVGSKPDEGYKAGSWDVMPVAGMAISGNTTFTYTYASKPKAGITTYPASQTLSYNGLSQNLVTAGVAETSIEYSLNGTDYSTSLPAGKDAGKYTVYYRAKADADHMAGDAAILSVNIAKAELTVTAAPNTITYGDAPAGNGVSYAGFVNKETAEVLVGTLAYDFDYSQYGNAGSYTITPKGLTSGNYDINYKSGTLTVNKKTVGLSWSSEALIYNGSAQAPAAAATQTVNNDVIAVTVTGAKTDAGTGYTATATALTGEKAGNYQLPSVNTTTFSIAKAAAQTIADVTLGKLYTAASVSASVAGKMPTDAGTLSYTAGTASVAKASGSNITVSNFTVNNSGEVTADIANGTVGDVITLPVTIGSTNYADSTVNVVITLQDKAATNVTITGGNNITKTYGDADFTISATAPAAAGNGSFTYQSSSENVVSVDNTGKVSIKKSGTATITVSFESDTHKGSAEIVLTVNKAKAAVSAAAVSASGLKYNGQAQALLASGAAADTAVEYSLDGNAYSDTIPSAKNAGSYTVYYRAKADDNHTVGDAEQLTVTIAKADAIVSANNASKSYGASDPQLSAAVTGTFGTDSLSYSISREEGENAGKYVITPSGDAVQGNYNVTYKTAIFTIDPLAISPAVSLSQNSYVYDGTEKKPAVSVKNGNNELAATDYTVKYSKNINAGTADVTVSANASSNYSFDEVTVHFTISKAPINPVVAIADWTQGSEPSTPVISGNPGNGAVTYSYKVKGTADSTYSAAVPSAVGRYTISANIAETANHLSGYATADFNIFKEAAVVTTAPAAYSLIYNGGAQALVSAGAVSGGTIKYAKGSSEAPAESFSEAIPAETNAGTYYVWYKAFGDDNHADSAMGSVMVVISKASQSAPAAPQKQSATTTSITLVPHYGYEYCRSGYAWQSSNTFNGLSADTEYTFYQRVSGDSNYEASPESAGAAFRTEALPTEEDPTPTKEAKPTPSENVTPTPSENVTPTPSENVTPTPSENVTPTPTGEDVPTPTGEVTPTPSVTVTPTPTAGPLPTFAPTPTPTPVIVEEAVIKFVFADDTNSFSAEYTGNAIKPEIKGYCGSKLLEEGKDYSVSYSKNTAVGKANVNISGKGGYSGRYTLEFSITPKRIDDNGAPAKGIIVSGLTVKGTSKVKPVLAYNGNVLNTKEYSVTSGNPNGTETVTITAKGKNFTGEIKDLPVTRINDKEAFKKTGIKAELANVSHVYDGTPKLLGSELKVTGKDGTTLIEGTDYVVSYPSDVINAGIVKVQIIGIGNYTGSVMKSYKIEPAKNAAVSVKLIPEEGMPAGSYSYSKNGVTPAVFVTATVSGNTYVLADGIDYTVKYSNNKKAGTAAAVKLSFRGNYKGAETGDVNFTIEKAGFKDAEIFVGDMLYGKSGNYKAKPVIKVNGEVVANREYKLSYSISGNNMPKKLKLTDDETEKLITVTATSTGKGFKENDTISATYRVYRDNKTEVKKAKVTLVEKGGSKKLGNVAYTGNPITFSPDNIYRQADIQVKIGKTVLTGEDVFKNFEVSYADNVAKGKATIILTAKEDSVYSGMCVGTFKIVTRKVK